MEKKVINHFCHKHSLVLTEHVSDKESPNCYGCGIPVGDLEMAYVCMEQDCRSRDSRIILHKKCGELPSQIHYPKHPQHPMKLVFDFRKMSDNWCDICSRDIGPVFWYRCSSCNFDIHTTCVGALLEERKELQHPSHPHHPLTLMRKPAFSFLCDGCGAQDVDMAYICSTCEFMVHKSCALLPSILPTDDQYHPHHHPLFLIFSLPEEHRNYYNYKNPCDVCDKHLDPTCWLYFCSDCRYFLHLKCVGSTAKLSKDDDGGGSNVVEFPLDANDISSKLITPFVMRETALDHIPRPDQIKDAASYSYLSNYHELCLSLVSKFPHKETTEEENDQEEGGESRDDELKICDVCVTPISSPPYYESTSHASCTYLIHFICCFLPKTISHPSSSNPTSQLYGDCQNTPNRNHNFTLYAPNLKSKGRDAISYWWCDLCGCATNGMGYKCEDCGIKIDIKCASLPTTIRHAFHPRHNPLLLTRIPPRGTRRRCHGCYRKLHNVGYCCGDDDCDFALDLECVMLPKSIREREWDKHPLLLMSDASLDHPSDFFCEFCEREMNPKKWMYHCRQCDVSFHLDCSGTGSGTYRNVKLGGQYELGGVHPNHPLTFTYITLKRRCDLCHYYVYGYVGLECASCYYVVCEDCGGKELEKN